VWYSVEEPAEDQLAGKLDRLMSATPPQAVPRAPDDGEAALVAAAKSGDTNAFESLVNRYERKIFRLAMNVTQNREDAEDVMQEAFLKAYTHLQDFQGDSRFYTWLVRITVNEGLMKLRKRRPGQISIDEKLETEDDLVIRELEDWGPSPEDRFAQTQMREILDGAIKELEEEYRIVFQLRDVEQFSTEETAEVLGLSVPAVKSRLLRARLRLRQKLNRYFRKRDAS
jgi:RNA polymerase sigma-70 factor (ECF subfamily)